MSYQANSRRKAHAIELLGGSCQHCGYSRSHRALHFHHVDGSDKYEWTKTGRVSLREVEAHPERFLLLCANCHSEEHERLESEMASVATCITCGTTFRTSHSLIALGRGKFCTQKCARDDQRKTALLPETVEARFLSYVEKSPSCWGWRGPLNNGSPQISLMAKSGRPTKLSAAKYSYELRNGSVPHGLLVIRTCTTSGCVNPEHLVVGTARDKSKAIANRGNTTQGEKSASHKLTEQQIREIRESYATGTVKQSELATEYGLHQVTVSQIVLRKRWAHLD